MSKGSRQRQGNKAKFEANYDKIFGAKNVTTNESAHRENEKAVNSE